jgi:hypothetical protein
VLLGHGVDFLIVGATAAVLDGAPLTTFDLDVVFEPSPRNRERLLGALAAIDAVYVDPLRRGIRPTEERLATHRLSLFETRLGRLDVLTSIQPGWGWAELVPRSHQIETAGMVLRVLDLEAVIESKLATGRGKDHAALPLLREVLRQRDGT